MSVIIPVYNGRQQIVPLLECLRNQDVGKEQFETILVDDGSTDGTAEFVRTRFPEVRVVTTRNGGSYAARNAGLKVARGRILAFTDADCRPERSWLSRGLQAMGRDGADLVAGAVVVEAENHDSAFEFYDLSFGINQRFYATYLGFGATANLFAKREIADAVGGFDGELRSGGDQKFCKAAVAAGAVLRYDQDAAIRHEVRSGARANIKKVIRVSVGLAQISPRWSHLRLMRLSSCHREFFDYRQFMATRTLWFRLRFRFVYYLMGACFLAAYVKETLFGRSAALNG